MENVIPLILSKETITAIEKVLNEVITKSASELNTAQNVKMYMNKKEVAEYIGVSFNTLKKFIKAGLKTVEIEGIEMIRKVDIDEFIEKRVK
ncbi:helix-turn-helix domain-containing protein [Staphylococcus coagulans]|uniref:helix-turn-helix domain-containing protein n=2 Tax=Staphylococcus coagulans TaxID=74706 RepID=UPI0030ECD8E6